MPPDSPHPLPPPRPASRFTIAAWIILLGGLLLTFVAYQLAIVYRRPGEWLPGVGQALIGLAATALGGFACGFTALLRRERLRWWALVPFLAGLGTIVYFGWNVITKP
jgi:hypothetical protein